MVSHISHLTVDAHDPYRLSRWWCDVLGYHEDPDDPNLPEHDECMILSPDGGTRLLFIAVPDEKSVKNRLHLDLRPTQGTRDEELQRLLAAGAEVFDDRRRPDGSGWVVLTDPEGNEFCILRSRAEVDAART